MRIVQPNPEVLRQPLLALGQVVRVVLASNGLAGSIPPELGGLTNLNVLDLRNNQLTGTIPPELGNLLDLGLLHLRSNQLTGTIPAELGNLSNLGSLVLRVNQLTGTIPPELGNLSNLRILSLRNNQLTGAIPAELGNLSNLEILTLRNNQVTGAIPAELGNLSLLEFLVLRVNQLTGLVPIPVADLGGQLQSISVGRCDFESNPGLFMPDTQDYQDADLDSDGFICGVPVGEVLPNFISLVTIAPPAGTTLSAGQVVSFTATVSYELNNADSGEIKMVVQDQTDADLQSGMSPFVEIGRGSGMVTLSNQVTTPTTGVTTISVFFPLFSAGQSSTTVISSVSYPVQAPVSISGRPTSHRGTAGNWSCTRPEMNPASSRPSSCSR